MVDGKRCIQCPPAAGDPAPYTDLHEYFTLNTPIIK
jgi:hypothetical protein